MSYLNISRFMPTLLDRKDRMSMAVGLEVRVPYCDHRLVEYVFNIPWQIKMAGNREKGILRQSLEGVLPEDVLYRKKSPYPKTHNPNYLSAVRTRLLDILNEGNSPLLPLINVKKVREIAESEDSQLKLSMVWPVDVWTPTFCLFIASRYVAARITRFHSLKRFNAKSPGVRPIFLPSHGAYI